MMTDIRTTLLTGACIGAFFFNMIAASATESPLGANYHIARQHPEASDANPGSAEKPFKSIEGAFEALAPVVEPGDNIWIHDGLYRGVNLWLIGAGHSRPESIMPSDREGNRGCVSDYNIFFRTGQRGEHRDTCRRGVL